MKKHVFIFSLVILLFSACTAQSVIDKELDDLEIDAADYTKIDTLFFKSTKIRHLTFKKNNHEISVSFYESGKKRSYYQYKDGTLYNKSFNWNENGNLETSVDQDTHELINYWENGKIKFKKIDDTYKSYHYLNGNYMVKISRLKDRSTSYELYHENGDLSFSGIFRVRILYKNNAPYTGKIVCYFNDGKISSYQEVKNGKDIGKYYGYYGNGNLRSEGEVGVYSKDYYENGNIQTFRDDKNKLTTEYDKKGKVISKSTF